MLRAAAAHESAPLAREALRRLRPLPAALQVFDGDFNDAEPGMRAFWIAICDDKSLSFALFAVILLTCAGAIYITLLIARWIY